jgi:acyl dehydratase
MPSSPPPPLTFALLRHGRTFAPVRFTLDGTLTAPWSDLFPGSAGAGGTVPRGCLLALFMRGYVEAVAPRPPGNIHANQKVRWHGTARYGDTVTVGLRCLGGELRRGRPWVRFGGALAGPGGPVLDSELEFVWAA